MDTEINSTNDSTYVILANAYASSSRRDEMWKRMKDKKVRSMVGIVALKCSDKRHGRTNEINAKLEELTKEIEKFDYVYVWAEMLHKEEENAMKKAIWYQSEKLAI
ncbi:hypothetical protein FXO38_09623 [Capsicum annuum]|uniref:Uncharacterized protein n=1 Tax=Capsicum annuum TaxID=4072 RepID=A0A2G2Y1J3_CAPAN|nr:hypothetical protein FXO38_09623 [Capsicum annuum]KAF3668053.1 hypothetical protein FXO37_09720 [Capsicum annuum]PHT63626.1 hypothetical protein T459_32561 [Capsicum annuum]